MDAVHEIKGAPWENDIQEWVRQLQSKANVLIFIASDHGPSSRHRRRPSDLRRGACSTSSRPGAPVDSRKTGGPMSLFDFERTVTDAVLAETGRKQHAQLYLPETFSYQVPFLDPSPVPR